MSRLHLKIDDLQHAIAIPEGHKLSFSAEVFDRAHVDGDHPAEPTGSRKMAALRFEAERLKGSVLALEEISEHGRAERMTPAHAETAERMLDEADEKIAQLKQQLVDAQQAHDGTKAGAEQRFGELGEMHRVELEAKDSLLAAAQARIAEHEKTIEGLQANLVAVGQEKHPPPAEADAPEADAAKAPATDTPPASTPKS